ncbi:hypothetical protein BYT27DRAFT_7140165 [Phlegmacium glaucopus]|nr:hypothetical protein BYT27DRAFT_7140165 [Phlegmacium glaucopus]
MSSTIETSQTTGRPGLRRVIDKTVNILGKEWLYIGIGIFLALLNLILGILTLSYLHPKKEPLVFGIVCLNVLLALSHFSSLCYLLQRAKEEMTDRHPSYTDTGYAIGVVVLFVISGIVLSIELPSRCFSGPNAHFKAIGQACCSALTAMAVGAWLGVLTMIIGTIIIFLTARKVIELAKQPPPVFPSGTEAPVMRWLDRNDPFLTSQERRYANV